MRSFLIEGGLAPYASLTPAASGSPWKATRALLVASSMLLLTACDLAPDLKMPEVFTGEAFKHDTAEAAPTVEPASDGKWKRVDDKARIVEFAWWRMFGDDNLNALMEQAMKDNPSLEVALMRVKSARAAAGERDADLYPSIELGAGPSRSRPAAADIKANSPPGAAVAVKPHTFYTVNGTISYEVDLFGRNRNLAKAAWADAAGEEDNYLASRLSLQTELAQTYFRLAALTAEDAFLSRTIVAREQSLKLTKQKYDLGSADALVLASSEADLAAVKGEAASVKDAKNKAENALAVLVGQTPSQANFKISELKKLPPTVPAGLPSSLLERRPDIKRAVEGIKAANARIGVARTGYFPEISLSAMGGFVSSDLNDLFKWSNRTWAIGPMAGTVLTQPIFEGGRIAAARAQSDADYNASVATYRDSVLQAFREVEDQLSSISAASARTKAATSGLDAATRAYKVADDRYKAGYSSHLDFLDAERNQLAAQRTAIQTRGDQYVTTIQLIKALGGSWQAPKAPEPTGTTTMPAAEQAPAPVTTPAATEEKPSKTWSLESLEHIFD